MRTLDQLIDTEDPGIDVLREWSRTPDANASELLPPDPGSRGRALERLQVTTRSLLGAVVYETGGVVIDHGRLRLFGSGSARSILRANGMVGEAATEEDGVLLVADDYIGGLFALNGGRFGADRLGEVFHLPPDRAGWHPLEVGYADFVSWCLSGDLSVIYGADEAARYAGAQRGIGIDKVNSFYPFLWTAEAGAGTDVRLVDADESLRLRIALLGYAVEDWTASAEHET